MGKIKLNKFVKMFAAGDFVIADKKLEVRNPYDDSLIACTYQADKKVLNKCIKRAQKVREKLFEIPSHKKYEILMQIHDGIEENFDLMAKTLARESGKPWIYASGEISRAMATVRAAAEESKRIYGEWMPLDWTSKGEGHQGIVRKFPIGLVAGISPFNFPLNLAMHKIAPAIASGCPIILKPASATPLSTLLLAQIIAQTDLPKGAVSILPMDRETGDSLVTDDRFNLLSFTGSPHVGWDMKARAGKKKVVLELGGNAGMVVTDNCDLEKAIDGALVGAFAYSGQVCIHVQRIFLQEGIYAKFLRMFKSKAKKLVKGAPTDKKTQISSMIDEKNAMRIEKWVNEAKKARAKVVLGGKRKGSYYPPTILTNTKPDMKVCKLEAFAPIVAVEKFKKFEDAIEMINDSDFGLQAGVFTDDINEAFMAFEKLEVGGVMINQIPTFRVDHMPYGGVKESGLGREGLRYAIEDMTEPRIMVIKS